MLKTYFLLLTISGLVFLASCGGDGEEATPSISLLGTTINGIPLVDGTINVGTDARIELTFSSTINAGSFESAFSLNSPSGSASDLSFSYTNASSKAVIAGTLEPDTEYTLSLGRVAIGQNGAVLDKAISLSFTTLDDGGVITELPPCTSASNDCLRSITAADGSGNTGSFDFYSTFPLDLDNAAWQNLTTAIIVVHGVNRDANDYFSYMVRTLQDLGKLEEAMLIAPFFKAGSDAEAGDLYWSSSAWREGGNAQGPASVSSFAVADRLMEILADQTHFPVLEKVIVAGHSSGALFAQVYAAANRAEPQHSHLDFEYVVANSQYFYYPDPVRWNEGSQQFTSVSGCSSFDIWPMGFRGVPAYLSSTSEATVDANIVQRKVTYLLGTNDVSTTGTLNTSDCSAVLLGRHRFARGENIHRLITTNYPDTHQSTLVTVSGIGHNGQAMFQSSAFQSWLEARF